MQLALVSHALSRIFTIWPVLKFITGIVYCMPYLLDCLFVLKIMGMVGIATFGIIIAGGIGFRVNRAKWASIFKAERALGDDRMGDQ